MTLIAFGVNHRSAPLSIREQMSFRPEDLPDALRALVRCPAVAEAAILSTCNRTDLYCELRVGGGEAPLEWFQHYHNLRPAESLPHLYTHHSEAAVRHIMRVASGLDSMVLGEPQILGQVKSAYRTASRSGTIGPVLGRLFQQTFGVAKQVRADTAIGSHPVSVAFAAVCLTKQVFDNFKDRTALMIGAGETIELAARHLKSSGLGRIIIANRTLETAQRLASELGGYGVSIGQLEQHLSEADLVFSSTASATPILTSEQVRNALARSKRRPMLIVDIAVPRDVEAGVGELEDVYLYTIDDLKGVVQEGTRSRREAAHDAERIIGVQIARFMGWLGTLQSVPTIRAYRDRAQTLRDEVLGKARRRLNRGDAAEDVLGFLARTLTNKLLHAPTVQLRRAGASTREDLIDAARMLLAIGDEPAAPDAILPRVPPSPTSCAWGAQR